MAVKRFFGLAHDSVAGGSAYDDLSGSLPEKTVPVATKIWPVTGGTVDKNAGRIDRANEVRGVRNNFPPLPFRQNPVITVPVLAYRSLIEKLFARAFGKWSVAGAALPAPQTHTLTALNYADITSGTKLNAFHASLVRDDHYERMSGGLVHRATLNAPLDSEATLEAELRGLYIVDYGNVALPTGLPYADEFEPMMLRDAKAFLGSGGNEIQLLTGAGGGGAPADAAGGTYTLTYSAQTTTGIAFGANAAAIQAALEALSNIAPGDVIVTGGPLFGAGAAPVTIEFTGTLAATDVTAMTGDGTLVTGPSSPYTVTVTEDIKGGSSVPDLQGIEFTINNNTEPKWYAGKNVQARTFGTLTRKMWWPEENKLGAVPDFTFAINLGNVDVAQELSAEFAEAKAFAFEFTGSPLGTTPAADEFLRITLYRGVFTGGGPEALSAREDITARYEGAGFWDPTSSRDVKIEIVNSTTSSLLTTV